MSVRLSACPLHAGIDSKLMTVGSRGYHHPVAQGHQLPYPGSREALWTGLGKNCENADFRPINRYISAYTYNGGLIGSRKWAFYRYQFR